jgi:hypothetical protein
MARVKHDQEVAHLISAKDWKAIISACEEYELDVI